MYADLHGIWDEEAADEPGTGGGDAVRGRAGRGAGGVALEDWQAALGKPAHIALAFLVRQVAP